MIPKIKNIIVSLEVLPDNSNIACVKLPNIKVYIAKLYKSKDNFEYLIFLKFEYIAYTKVPKTKGISDIYFI